MKGLEGKVAIVTGGASGLGLAAAQRLADEGVRVVLADVADAAAEAGEFNGLYVETDVADSGAVESLVAKTVDAYGRLDIYFNNAGIEFHGPLTTIEPEQHRRMVEVNLNGVYFGLQSAIRAMLENEGPQRGSIINTSSVAGLTGCPMLSSYNATKGAVVLMTKNAAVEYAAFGIRVNAICPGIIRTPMAVTSIADMGDEELLEDLGARAHPLGRIGEPEDVAAAVAFLASEESSFISGVALAIDGAMTAGFNTSAFGAEDA
mgnify:CR=1 FL=1|jgi:NAD(P)-dependent dehydrogenase (short-subunit alcohol dehydrogenase family)